MKKVRKVPKISAFSKRGGIIINGEGSEFMKLKEAIEFCNISTTYYYKLKEKANGDPTKLKEEIEQYAARKDERMKAKVASAKPATA